jgi:hypothetical protein
MFCSVPGANDARCGRAEQSMASEKRPSPESGKPAVHDENTCDKATVHEINEIVDVTVCQ